MFNRQQPSEQEEIRLIREAAARRLEWKIRELREKADNAPTRHARLRIEGKIRALRGRIRRETDAQVRAVQSARKHEQELEERQRKAEDEQRFVEQYGLEYCAECVHREGNYCKIAEKVISDPILEICQSAGWRKIRVSHREGGKTHTSSSGRRRESGAKEK